MTRTGRRWSSCSRTRAPTTRSSPRPVKFVGLQNYVDLLTQSDTFWIAVRNTLWMVIIMVPLRTLFALFAAWSISRIKSGAHFYRTLFFIPAIVPVVGAALAFIVMLN